MSVWTADRMGAPRRGTCGTVFESAFRRIRSLDVYPTVREFVAALDRAGELRRIAAPIDPVLEIAALADAESKSPCANLPSAGARRTDPRFHHLGGQALLCEHVNGSDVPVLINAFGSYLRMEMALGCVEQPIEPSAFAPGSRPVDSQPAGRPFRASPGSLANGHTPGGFEAIAARLAEIVRPEPPRSVRALIAKAATLAPLLRIPPRRRSRAGLCQQVVLTGDKIDLRRWPIIRCWPLDGDLASVGYPPGVNAGIPGVESGPEWEARFRGRYITLGGIHSIHADDAGDPRPASHNIGMYRAQLLGPRHLAMHWHMHHDGARHWRSWKALGQRMPVAIVLGGESVLPYAATAPLPPGMSELLLAGLLNRGGIELCPCKTVPLHVPANAEIVIEGWVSHEAGLVGWDPRDPRAGPLGPGAVFEGPFGDHTGFYSMPDRYPLLEVTAITHRRDPIYPTTVVGLPPQEDYFLGKATERLFLPLLKVLIPDIEDYDLPMFGAFHNCAFVQVKKQYPLHARRVMHAIWGAGQMAWTKTIVVVDDDVDVHDAPAVLRAVGAHCQPGRDTELVRGPLDILDHAAPFLGAGAKMGLDATRAKSEAESHRHLEGLAAELCASGPLPPATGADARAVEARVGELPGVLDARVPDELGGWWLLVRARKDQAGDGERIIKALGALADGLPLPRWSVVVGPDADTSRIDDALFHWMANAAAERDRRLSVCGRRVAFDATPKVEGSGEDGDERHGQPVRAWPPILAMPEAVRARVLALGVRAD